MLSASAPTLYVLTRCPYCHKVEKYAKEHDVTLKIKNVAEPKFKQELIDIGGKKQVPCLVYNGKALYESDLIIEWIKENMVQKQ